MTHFLKIRTQAQRCLGCEGTFYLTRCKLLFCRSIEYYPEDQTCALVDNHCSLVPVCGSPRSPSDPGLFVIAVSLNGLQRPVSLNEADGLVSVCDAYSVLPRAASAGCMTDVPWCQPAIVHWQTYIVPHCLTLSTHLWLVPGDSNWNVLSYITGVFLEYISKQIVHFKEWVKTLSLTLSSLRRDSLSIAFVVYVSTCSINSRYWDSTFCHLRCLNPLQSM